MNHPYAVPRGLAPDLARVQAYWKGLLRGAAEMPFWDDAKLSDLPDLAGRLFLIDVFERPDRFRFNSVGRELAGEAVLGKFLDEVDVAAPFEFLDSQCSSTVESAAPSYFRRKPKAGSPPAAGYARLVLPMWGEGRVSMLLGAVDFS
jgi:hypothetical protein